MKPSTVPCPQCSVEHEYSEWSKTQSSESPISQYYTDKYPCPICKNKRKIPVTAYLKLIGKFVEADRVKKFFETYRKPVLTPSGYVVPLG
jgi:hypothetical protein